jgi:hypothetical protein
MLERAVELMAPLVADEQAAPTHTDLQAKALLGLGRIAEARPLVERLHAAGWHDEELREMVASSGMD